MADWPRWFFHFDCPDGKIFQTADEVPEGWVESPADIKSEPLQKMEFDDNLYSVGDAERKRKPPGRPRKVK